MSNKADALQSLGKYDDALTLYEKVLSINPNDIINLVHYPGSTKWS